MASELKRSSSFRFNFDLVMTEIARWPIATLIVMVLVSTTIVLVEDPRLHLTPALASLLAAGYSCAILGGKALLLLMAYPRIHKARFPGSYLLSSFIVFIPIFVFYATGLAAVLNSIPDKPPPAWALLLFLLFSYVLFSVVFAAFMPFQHAMLISSEPLWNWMVARWKALFRGRQR